MLASLVFVTVMYFPPLCLISWLLQEALLFPSGDDDVYGEPCDLVWSGPSRWGSHMASCPSPSNRRSHRTVCVVGLITNMIQDSIHPSIHPSEIRSCGSRLGIVFQSSFCPLSLYSPSQARLDMIFPSSLGPTAALPPTSTCLVHT